MGNTPSEIMERMKKRLSLPASTMEGSFTADNIQAVANELGKIYSEDYDRLISRSHITTAVGEDLDVAAKENHGMVRNSATYEQVNLLFTGTPGTVIDENMGAYVDDIIFMVAGNYEISDTGSVLATAICTESGSGYQVSAGVVINLLDPYEGITSVINPDPSSGGYDRETDDDFRSRILENEADTPGYGNIAWYRATAKEVTGVEKAKVFDVARGKGTVDVVIIASGNQAASQVLVQRVADHIEDLRLAGVDVLVESGVPFSVAASAAVYLDPSVSLASVTAEFKGRLMEYLDSIEFVYEKVKSRVSLAKVSELLLGCSGVTDIENLQLNGSAASIELEERCFPVAEEPGLTLAE